MNLSADEILAISVPSKLFAGDGHSVYKQLVRKWHPDRGAPRATEVCAHINHLYSKFEDGYNRLRVTIDYKDYDFSYLEERAIAGSTLYFGTSIVVQIFDNSVLFGHAEKHGAPDSFIYMDAALRAEHQKNMPGARSWVLHDGKPGYKYKRPDGFYSLAQIKRKFPVMPPEHVAWILSSAYNINAYLSLVKRSYGGFNLETYFVSPVKHEGHLLGGWAYSSMLGRKPIAAPAEQAGLGDYTTKQYDSACIRKMGRDLLGAEFHKAPLPMQLWLKRPGRPDSVQEYTDWMKVLTDSFGKRKFVVLDFNDSDL